MISISKYDVCSVVELGPTAMAEEALMGFNKPAYSNLPKISRHLPVSNSKPVMTLELPLLMGTNDTTLNPIIATGALSSASQEPFEEQNNKH